MAEIKFPCPGCKVTLRVSDTLAGKKIKCPKCAAIAPIPAATGTLAASKTVPLPAAVAKPLGAAAKPAAPIQVPFAAASPSPPAEDDIVEVMPLDEAPTSAPRKKALPRKSSPVIPILATVLVVAYLTGLALVYFGILLPMPEPLKMP